MAERGFFLTVEGIDGAGKSTQARRLADRLRVLGYSVIETREPGGAPGAEEIRKLLVEGAPGRWSAETESLLFTAARRDHVERTVEPALVAGSVVICDRYVDSTRAYQGTGASELRQMVDRLHALAIGLDPDLTLIFDVDAKVGLSRTDTRANGAAENRFEQKGEAFQARLRQEFLAIAKAEPRRCVIVDAALPPDRVAEHVWDAVSARLEVAP